MPVGPGTYGRFLAIRVFDFWVHERDITTPLGRDTDHGGVAAEIALEQVENSIGYNVGKWVGLHDGKSLTFHLTGPLARRLHVAVDGRAARVDHVERPDVTVTADSRRSSSSRAGASTRRSRSTPVRSAGRATTSSATAPLAT
ncbi:hypothetical protein MDOR_10470 [Mycolicibacterium doricum]|uniref:Uncharacterized protein n=2 Tax=Mycolicibacterium doricum TaxID=126673 RepID=A0A7I7VTS5_9MYCO|nr:hypothetical protein MDOR_10470 [Mycolicibacterium doricum]